MVNTLFYVCQLLIYLVLEWILKLCWFLKFILGKGVREMAQGLRAIAAFPEDPGSVPSTRIRWLTIACNSRELRPLTSEHTCSHIHIRMQAHTYI